MQLLSLASLACGQRELPYNTVAESLQIKPDDVEHWIISGIGAKLIDAKMDQLRRVVIITYVVCQLRSFSFLAGALRSECSRRRNGHSLVDPYRRGVQIFRMYSR
jgi:hypothetical protein